MTINIVEVAAFAALKKNGRPFHASERPHGAVHATGEVVLGGFKKFAAAGASEGVGGWIVALIHAAKVAQRAAAWAGVGRVAS